MLLHEIVETSRRVAGTRARTEKIGCLAACLAHLAPDEVEPGVAWLAGETRQGRIGVGYAALRDARPDTAARRPALEVGAVDRELSRLAALHGRGSAGERLTGLRALLTRATREEQDFLTRLLLGELRQGALAGIMLEAIAKAAAVPAADVRRAAMLCGDSGAVARAALAEGAPGLARFAIRLFRPLQPMLAQTADGVGDALARLGPAALEWKLDGARVQVHREGDAVRVFTRRLNDVTEAVPELVEAARALPLRAAVLDGEVIALREDGAPQPFQVTMRRFGRRLDAARLREALPLASFFFDCLHLDGEDLIDRDAGARFEALASHVAPALRVPRLAPAAPPAAEAFLAEALRRGHEGVVAKALDARYEAGRRGASWLKVKPVHTLDLVVLAAEWGSGRRRGWLSNLHLGARDPAGGGFVMLGKTFKGLSDELLAWQTERLKQIEVARDAHGVYVRPELVVEIAFDGVQVSPHYPGGLALRFARVKRYRPDKSPAEADSIETLRALHARAREA